MGWICHITNNKHIQVAHALKIAVLTDGGVKFLE